MYSPLARPKVCADVAQGRQCILIICLDKSQFIQTRLDNFRPDENYLDNYLDLKILKNLPKYLQK